MILFHQEVFSQAEYGIKAGTNFTNISLRAKEALSLENDVRLSYHIGVFGNLALNNKISASADLLYSNKGYATQRASGEEVNIYFHYINLPLLLNYALTQDLKFGLGPEFGYLLSARSKYNEQSMDVGILYKNKFDIGLDAAVDFSASEFLHVGLRYNYGLSSVWGNDIQITDQQGYLVDTRIQNRVLQIYIGYILKKN
jgi:hypothetical protein